MPKELTNDSVYQPTLGEHFISTSERAAFKRCRRMWQWGNQDGYRAIGVNFNLWFGSGFHYALEQYHGWGEDPFIAWDNYVKAHTFSQLPPSDEVEEGNRLAKGMLDHYVNRWLPRRDDFTTYFINGIPQVEVEFKYRVGSCQCHDPAWPIFHVGTFDRIVTDPYGRLWVQDYKTASQFDTDKLPTDAQVTSYSLFAALEYGLEFEGVLYTQFLKRVPDFPKRLQNGSFSVDMRQSTTYEHYRQALISEYGSIPDRYIDVLNHYAQQENENGDRFIHQETVRRNKAQLQNEWQAIQNEIADMFDPNLRIYKNATVECPRRCEFHQPCIAKDDGTDYLLLLEDEYHQPINARAQTWRQKLHQSATNS